MPAKIIFLATISLLVIFPYVVTFAGNNGGAHITAFQHIGTFGRTAFFAESAQKSWADAKTLCTSSGMELAAVTRTNITDIFQRNLTSTGPFWTAGRDVGTLRQFVWDANNGTIREDVVNLAYFPRQCSCIFFNRISTTEGNYGGGPCSAPAGVLCQLVA